jgi:hypothetical protein
MGFGSHEDLAVEVYPLQLKVTVVPGDIKATIKASKKVSSEVISLFLDARI